MARIVSAVLSGSIARIEDHEKSDINLMIVGGGPARKPSPHQDPRPGNAMEFALASHFSLDRAPTEFYKHSRAFLGVTAGNVP